MSLKGKPATQWRFVVNAGSIPVRVIFKISTFNSQNVMGLDESPHSSSVLVFQDGGSN